MHFLSRRHILCSLPRTTRIKLYPVRHIPTKNRKQIYMKYIVIIPIESIIPVNCTYLQPRIVLGRRFMSSVDTNYITSASPGPGNGASCAP